MDKKLLTPGPLTTSMTTKEAMLHDYYNKVGDVPALNMQRN